MLVEQLCIIAGGGIGGSGSVLSGPGPATSPPSNPGNGAIWYNETTGGVQYWNVTLQQWE